MNHRFQYGVCLPLLATVLLMAGCGIKPNQLTPPSGGEGDSFPHTYPAPDTKK